MTTVYATNVPDDAEYTQADTDRDLQAFANALEVVGMVGPHIKPDGTLSNVLTSLIVVHTLLGDPQRKEAPSCREIRDIIEGTLVPMAEAEKAPKH